VPSEHHLPEPSPARWVPTLYFAEGLPFYAVNLMALVFYQRAGLRNEVIALTISLLALPWSLKPLWSPFLEMYQTKRLFVVTFEILAGVSLALLALTLPLPGYFRYSVALLALVGVCSSSHDIVADGLYIASLRTDQQSAFAGWQGGFYNVARFLAQGGLIIAAGWLEKRMDLRYAWMLIFLGVGICLFLLGLYHSRALPRQELPKHKDGFGGVWNTYWDVMLQFFRKPNILLLLFFVLLYRAGTTRHCALRSGRRCGLVSP
jgi:MFS transporter, PAT family, beta-lactamase induction signal transducer AmpG